MSAKHTPGPWTAVSDPNGWTLEGRGMSITAEAFDCSNADARLIAAAPDMLAALEYFRGLYGDPNTWPDADAKALSLAVAAIAIAKEG